MADAVTLTTSSSFTSAKDTLESSIPDNERIIPIGCLLIIGLPF
jgi:hypothetical protein